MEKSVSNRIYQLAESLGMSEGLTTRAMPITEEQRAKQSKYWESVLNHKGVKLPKEISSIKISYQEATQEFKKLRLRRGIELAKLNPNFKWMFTPEDVYAIDNLLRYFIDDYSIFNPSKGVLLYSNPGVGKSEFMSLLSEFTNNVGLQKKFEYSNMTTEYTNAKSDKEYNAITKLIQKNRLLDEFLYLDGDVNNFGNKININEVVIYERDIRHSKSGQLTHICTNLTPLEIALKLNNRIMDRLKKLCTFFHWEGESKRG